MMITQKIKYLQNKISKIDKAERQRTEIAINVRIFKEIAQYFINSHKNLENK